MIRRITTIGFALLCVAGTASAAPLLLPPNVPLFIQFENIEQVNLNNSIDISALYAPATGTQGNWGLLNVNVINRSAAETSPNPEHWDIAGNNGNIFTNDGPLGSVGQITGIFYGIQINPNNPTIATGGFIDLYWHDAGSDTIGAECMAASAPDPCEPNAATVARFTTGNGGVFLARIAFNFGICSDADVPLELNCGFAGNEDVHIHSNVDPASGVNGEADSFGDVDFSQIGPWTELLDGNWFFVDGEDPDNIRGSAANEIRDLRFSNRFDPLPAWDDPANSPDGETVGLSSNDPAKTFTVPEPVTLSLLGIGLGMVAYRRRRAA